MESIRDELQRIAAANAGSTSALSSGKNDNWFHFFD